MKPLVTFPDPLLETLRVFRAHPLLAGVEFGTKPVDVAVQNGPTLPYAAVSLDSSRGTYPVDVTASVRVRVWHKADNLGLDLANTLRAVLLAYGGDAQVRSFGELTAPVPTEDPDTHGPLSYFTVAARLRPITL